MTNKYNKSPKCNCKNKHIKSLSDVLEDVLALATDGSTVTIKELLEGTTDKTAADSNLKKATDLMNKEIKKQMDKVAKGERQILCDSPVKVDKKEDYNDSFIKELDEAFKRYESANKPSKADEIKVKNAFHAKDLKVKPKVRLINVNKTVSEMLEVIYALIKANANEGHIFIDFGDKSWDKWLDNVRPQTLEKVSDRIANHLDLNGFDVDVDFEIDDDEVYMTLGIEW